MFSYWPLTFYILNNMLFFQHQLLEECFHCGFTPAGYQVGTPPAPLPPQKRSKGHFFSANNEESSIIGVPGFSNRVLHYSWWCYIFNNYNYIGYKMSDIVFIFAFDWSSFKISTRDCLQSVQVGNFQAVAFQLWNHIANKHIFSCI